MNVQPTTSAESNEVETVIRMRRKPNERSDQIITVTSVEDRSRKRTREVEVCFYTISSNVHVSVGRKYNILSLVFF